MAETTATPPRLEVTFPGGSRVEARYRGQKILTDQPVKAGGEGSAASPFDLFLASIATCAGFYAQQFCRHRELSTDGLALSLQTVADPQSKMISRVLLHLELPAGFPDKYRRAIERSIDQCAVKRHLARPPSVELRLSREGK